MANDPVFVYEKDGVIQVLSMHDEAHTLKTVGWKLIASLDPARYIQGLLREYPALVRVMKRDINECRGNNDE
jgi:hypothetical protein